jgi:hypothetical protein
LEEQNNILEMLNKISDKYYPAEIVQDESEALTYSQNLFALNINEENSLNKTSTSAQESDQSLSGDSTSLNMTRLYKNHIYFKQYTNLEKNDAERENLLERYAFSDAIALSVMLGIWEKKLLNFTEKIEYISEGNKNIFS